LNNAPQPFDSSSNPVVPVSSDALETSVMAAAESVSGSTASSEGKRRASDDLDENGQPRQPPKLQLLNNEENSSADSGPIESTLVASRDEENVLMLFRRLRGPAHLLRHGDETALRDHLVMIHTPLVEHCARNFSASGEPVEDLVQEGYVGLIKAVDRFDPEKGVRFSTYACHLITGEVRHYLRDLGKIIHEPGWHSELRQRIARTSDQLMQRLGRPPTPEDIAEVLNIRVDSVRDVLRNQQVLTVDSLDADYNDGDDSDGGGDRGDDLASQSKPVEPQVDNRLLLGSALPQLRDLEKKAIQLFFFDECSKTEVAQRLGISVNYAAYLIKQGTLHLREIIETGEGGAEVSTPAQMRAAYLVGLLKSASEETCRAAGIKVKTDRESKSRGSRGHHVHADLHDLIEFVQDVDDEIRRGVRYNQQTCVLWVHAINWRRATSRLDGHQLQRASENAQTLARRCCRDVDKVSLLPLSALPGLHLQVLLPHTGVAGKLVADRMQRSLQGHAIYPATPNIMDDLKVEVACAIWH
jgi:RNA polymerase sigma-B factor